MRRIPQRDKLVVPHWIDLSLVRKFVWTRVDELDLRAELPAGRITLNKAAAGIVRHVLRDMRLTGQIAFSKIGRRVDFAQQQLRPALERGAQ
ncbi:MAG: hypothetical protein ABGZ35_10850 [Planctomycetaceae bacterium]